jgi:transposase
MYSDMKQWCEIRQKILVEGRSKRSVLREYGLHWSTLQKILEHSAPPGYQSKEERPKPKLGKYLDRIAQILKEDKSVHKKQRHTAKRIWERLKEEGFTGGYTIIKEAVADLSRKQGEVFVPLKHEPGEAQVDFGEALVKMAGVLRKFKFFVLSWAYSDAFFVQAFERECTESFWEGHVRAFEYFGCVPKTILYDNSRIAVIKIVGRERDLTKGFLELQSHYLFTSRFCQPRRGNEKGIVEGAVKYARLNFMVPVPEMRDFEELNKYLIWCCGHDQDRKVRGAKATKAELLKEDQEASLALAASRFDACRKQSTHATSLSLVRFDDNDYSVPSRFAHYPIEIKGYVDRVRLFHQGEKIAEHSRIWERQKVTYDPIHYLSVLEKKPGAFDQAMPLQEWELPSPFFWIKGRLEEQNGTSEGTREYIQVLRFLENHSVPTLQKAIEKALCCHWVSKDLVGQYLYPDPIIETFCLDKHPHLRGVVVQKPNLSLYQQLIGERS